MKYSLYIDLVQHGIPQAQAELINAKYKNIIIKPNRLNYSYVSDNENKGIEIKYDSTSVSFNVYVPVIKNNKRANCDDMIIEFVNKETEELKEENKNYSLYLDLLDHCIPADQAYCLSRLLEKFIYEPNMLNFEFHKDGINREIIIKRETKEYSFEITVPLIKNNNVANVRDIEVTFSNDKKEFDAYLEMKNGNFKMSFVRECSDEVKDGFYIIEGKTQDFNSRIIKEEYYDDEAYQQYYERPDSFDDYDAYTEIMKDIHYEDSPKSIGLLPDYKNTQCIDTMSEPEFYAYVGTIIKDPNCVAKKMNNDNKQLELRNSQDYQLKLK